MDAGALLRLSIRDLFPGRIALVSSFGADSAVLLHMVAQIEKSTPVVFVDTGFLFPETLAYRDELVALLGLTDVRVIQPSEEDLAALDPEGLPLVDRTRSLLRYPQGEAACPSHRGLRRLDHRRKRFQSGTRATLPLFEAEGERVKINPLAGWGRRRASGLSRPSRPAPTPHWWPKAIPPLGCIPCTSRLNPAEDARAGRWRGKGKTECGIHLGILSAGQDI